MNADWKLFLSHPLFRSLLLQSKQSQASPVAHYVAAVEIGPHLTSQMNVRWMAKLNHQSIFSNLSPIHHLHIKISLHSQKYVKLSQMSRKCVPFDPVLYLFVHLYAIIYLSLLYLSIIQVGSHL